MCHTAFYPGRNFDTPEDKTLVVLNFVIVIMNILTNGTVILLIVKTKQYRNQSLHLILMLSISDLCMAFISQPLIVHFLYGRQYESCSRNLILQFLFFFFPYFSVYMIAFIVYDRFIRITYLNKYYLVMTKWRFRFGILIVMCLTTLQVGLITVGSVKNDRKYGTIWTLPLNIIIIISEIAIYLKTIYNLQQYKKVRKNRLKESDKSLVKLAQIYLFMIICFFLPYNVINTIYGYISLNDQLFRSIQCAWLYSQLIHVCNAFANAITFLYINRRGRIMIKLFIQKSIRFCSSVPEKNLEMTPNVVGIKNSRSPTISTIISNDFTRS